MHKHPYRSRKRKRKESQLNSSNDHLAESLAEKTKPEGIEMELIDEVDDISKKLTILLLIIYMLYYSSLILLQEKSKIVLYVLSHYLNLLIMLMTCTLMEMHVLKKSLM